MKPGRIVGAVVLMVFAAAAQGQTAGGGAKPRLDAAALAQRVQIRARGAGGNATFVVGKDQQPIPVSAPAGPVDAMARDVLREYAPLFGITSVDAQLVETRVDVDELNQRHTTFEQVHGGVPVFSGMLKVHQNDRGEVLAINGDFHPVAAKLGTVPTIPQAAAEAAVLADYNAGTAVLEEAQLVIVDPGWYGDRPRGARLAYYFVVADETVPLREALFVDAHTGQVLDAWSLLLEARNRLVYNGNGGTSLPGTLARSEGQAPVASPADVNRAYDYAGDVYDYYFRGHSRDSIDGAGMNMVLTVNSNYPPCPNAQWNGLQMIFCDGTVTDDVTAHEIAHGVTQNTANLIYQNQSGQLNESYSDIFGELIDLFNGNAAAPGAPGVGWPAHPTGPGQDTPNNLRTDCSFAPGYSDGVRWLVGEDATAFGGAIRDMWDPTCAGDPDRNYSPLQTCNPADGGGVHSGSGIGNHAFAIVTDGKNFNGHNVTGIGAIKAGAVWYRALSIYLTPASDYADAYYALTQAASDLIGTTPNDPLTGLPGGSAFTAFDAAQVDAAAQAVEINTDGACGATVDILDPTPPDICTPRTAIFSDDFEGGVNGWTVAVAGGPDTPYNWVQQGTLPFGRAGTAWFCDDLDDGCAGADETAVHQLTSPVINIPAQIGSVTMRFTHYLATEPGYDGGNVKYRVNGGAWTLLPAAAFTFNEYNTTLYTGSSTNPLAGESAWSGAGGQWGTSLVDLTSLVTAGGTLQIRFEFGKDYCNGVDGWYVDDFEIYMCTCATSADCADGVFCNGAEDCVANFCVAGGEPCPGAFCNESLDVCVPAAFVEDFNGGNVQGWALRGTDSTASTGDWVFGNPNGTSSGGDQAQPEDPHEGSGCAFTGQNSDLGNDDVDSGVIYLTSPAIDLSGESSAQLVYVRWYYNRDLGVDDGDFFIAQVSSNNGSSWVTLEQLGTNVSANDWTEMSFDLEDYIALTSTVRLRFGASDGSFAGNIIEAALDDLRITLAPECFTAEDCADGDACNGAEICAGGTCTAGTPLQCDDGIACTVDTCEALAGCVNTANDGLCPDNGNFCDGPETCDAQTGCVSAGDPCIGLGQWCSEAQAQCYPFGDGDLDNDGDQDLRDYHLFQVCFGGPAAPTCLEANLAGGETIDLADLEAFVTALGASGPN